MASRSNNKVTWWGNRGPDRHLQRETHPVIVREFENTQRKLQDLNRLQQLARLGLTANWVRDLLPQLSFPENLYFFASQWNTKLLENPEIRMTETRLYEPVRLSIPAKPLFSLKPLDATTWLRSLLSKVFNTVDCVESLLFAILKLINRIEPLTNASMCSLI